MSRFIAVAGWAALATTGCKSDREGLELGGIDRSDGRIVEISAPFLISAPVIDGKLDDPAWANAAPTGALVSPVDGKPRPASRVNASARVAWDERALYLAMTVYEPEPSSPFSPTDVDPHIWSKASGIELMLQPGDRSDNRDYYEIQVDVAGAVWDTRFDDYNQPIRGEGASRTFGHQDWSGEVERAVHRADGRYDVEMAVPFAALGGAPSAGAVWRFNLYSFRDGQRDALALSPLLRQGNFHFAPRFARLVFAR